MKTCVLGSDKSSLREAYFIVIGTHIIYDHGEVRKMFYLYMPYLSALT